MATAHQVLHRVAAHMSPLEAPSPRNHAALMDGLGRPITDLRISVTDRCNFRCVYCRSANPENHMAEDHLLGWDELEGWRAS